MIRKIKEMLPVCFPDIVICIIGFFIISTPIVVAIFDYIENPIIKNNIDIQVKNEEKEKIDPMVVLSLYAAQHMHECEECTQENFPFCEKANSMVDIILGNDILNINLLKNY